MPSRNHHDPDSGLSWNETILSGPTSLSKQMNDFMNKSIGLPPLLGSPVSETGAGSLEDMAVRCLLGNLDALFKESLEGVPGLVAKRIWERIVRNNLQTLRLWQLFTIICSDDPPSSTHTTITRHHIPLSLVIPAIESPSLAYLTSLTLVDQIADSTASLPLLSTLSNLILLHIIGASTSSAQTSMITDSTLRLWSKRAIHQNGFPRLKMLFLRFQFGVTEIGLGELAGFKELEMCVTSRCGVKIKEAKKIVKGVGWKMTSSAFYSHADAILQDRPLGKNYIGVVTEYLTSTIATPASPSTTTYNPPLSLIQLGRQSPTFETNILHSINEVECWIRYDEKTQKFEQQRKRMVAEREEEKQEAGKKRRRIKEAKRRDLLGLLEGM
ncbi:hypothetical protein D6C94_04931 [Aureobasidium pullulans]|uniref:Uncharacterized protein n=1 Tax=Aureobasidium pullulans TaxID=5580 RepID=A0AB38LZH3_AURPU|nr:hypothetical protein D6C94_04931 [Aureobasidium pullulans]